MKKISKGLFKELISMPIENSVGKEYVEKDVEGGKDSDDLVSEEEAPANISLVGSPVYPRIFWGDSAKPLAGQFPESEYVDDNIHRTYQGLLSYLG